MRLLLLRNESRPTERARPRPYFLPCLLSLPGLALAVPCSRCCSAALALSSASAFLPFVYVLLFIGRTRETRAEQRGEDNFCSLLAAAASTATSLRFSLPPHSYPLHQFYGGHANFLFRMNELCGFLCIFSENWQFSLICCWLVFDNILPVFSVTRLAQNEGTDPGPNMLRLHRTIMGHLNPDSIHL